MSLKTRFMLIAVVWIIGFVLSFNVIVYHIFQRMSENSEFKLLWNKAQIMLRNPDVRRPTKWSNTELFNEFLAEGTLIRIITPDGAAAVQVQTDESLLSHPVVYRNTYYTEIVHSAAVRRLFIQVPIIGKYGQVGQLEIGKTLDVLVEYITVLVTALGLASIVVVVVTLTGGYYYMRLIFKPVKELVATMKKIQESGSFARLSPQIADKTDEIGKLAAAFNHMIDRLEENDSKQRQFIADASHELKTPLTVIESYTSLLQRWGGSDEAVRSEALTAISSETGRLKGLVASLLMLAESEREHVPEQQLIQLEPFIRSITESLSLTFQREIRSSIVPSGAAAMVEPESFRRVLVIVLDNALKYSSGPVDIDVYSERNQPGLGSEKLTVRITDRGVGIPEEDLPHIFERFYRVDKARSRQTGGSGLGLSIAKQLVAANGGTIQIESKPGKGTVITISLQ
jgi:signal transduction histidine kinase